MHNTLQYQEQHYGVYFIATFLFLILDNTLMSLWIEAIRKHLFLVSNFRLPTTKATANLSFWHLVFHAGIFMLQCQSPCWHTKFVIFYSLEQINLCQFIPYKYIFALLVLNPCVPILCSCFAFSVSSLRKSQLSLSWK